MLLDCSPREGKYECRAAIPCRPLVHVIRAQEDSTLACHQVERAFVKVRKVPGRPLGRSKPAPYRLYRESAPAQGMQSRSGETPNQRKMAQHQMIDFNRIICPPLPRSEERRLGK